MSRIYSIKRRQIVPAALELVWNFFTNPGNLQLITPKNMGFKIMSVPSADKVFPGQLIEYTVKPLFGIPIYWMTEITHVQEQEYFVDEQRFGPYSFWHHQHHFKETAAGVEMTDIVHYKIPYWFVGDIANSLLIKNRLAQIFDYRYNQIASMF